MPIVQQRDDAPAVATSMEGLAESESAAIAEPEISIMSTLTLPSNATSIRADITDGFSCVNKTYGYYADVDNDCQIFHVCLPVTYADGKENTFRWSFICPEETIFSQDSFTCMRPDDMTITCDESFQYYELNRNFGMVESEKENTEITAESENKEPSETILEAETQSEPIKPIVQEEEEKEAPKPVEQAVKVQKPNRRKPGVSYASQKKPINSFPLRKMPQIQPVMPETNANQVSEDNNEVINTIQEEEPKEEIKPVAQKFSRRPVLAMTTTIKDKIQSSKPESMNGIRTQLFNQNRKRPSMFNKKPVEQQEEEKPEMAPVQVESQPESQQMFSHMESDMSNTNAQTQVADSEIQSSETNEIFVKPEEPTKVEAAQTEEESMKVEEVQAVDIPAKSEKVEEPVEVLEAFEEIPAVIAEVMETQSAAEEEQEPKKEEQMPVIVAEETQTSAEEEQLKQEEEQMSVVAAEETKTAAEEEQSKQEEEPVSVMSAEAIQTATEEEHYKQEQQMSIISAEETQTAEESSQMAEEAQTAEDTQLAEETPVVPETQLVEEEETKSVEEAQSVEETQAIGEISEIQVIEKIEEPQAAEETQAVEELKPIEETLAVEEPKPVVVIAPIEDIQSPEESHVVEATQTMDEAKPVAEQPEQFPASEETEQVKTVAEPAIFENSEEGLVSAPVQTIEDMEAEKPAEAPESMQATEEMSHPDPMVQQMFEDLEGNKHSIGGFKPVDPVMAHEAEQLIADFINTLRKNDFTNETPGMIMQQHQHNNEESEHEHSEEGVVVQEEAIKEEASPILEKTEEEEEEIVKSNEAEEVKEENIESQSLSQENNAEEMQNVKEEAEEAKPEVMSEENTDNNESVALKSLKAQSSENVKESEKTLEQQVGSSNMMIMTNMPQDMYQIPVQVITAPAEEMPVMQQQTPAQSEIETENKPLDSSASSEDKLVEVAPAPSMMGGHKPLSIDDIVELVKERLDQMPKDDMETPMQLEHVLGDMQEENPTEEETLKVEETQPAQSEEEIVMPIYQRTVPVSVKVDAGVQTENQEQDLTVEQSETLDAATDVKEKSNRSYRSRSMLTPKLDPRKRRFLFKSDKFKSS